MPVIPGYGTCHRHGNANLRFIKQHIILSLLRKASSQVCAVLNKLYMKLNIISSQFLQILQRYAKAGDVFSHI